MQATPLFYPAMMVIGFVTGPLTQRFQIPLLFRKIITFYFILAIGAKGGMSLCCQGINSYQTVLLFIAGILIGLLTPFIANYFLQKTTSLTQSNRASIAAHYGSVSLVTFATATTFLESINVPYDGILVALVAVMELPAIFSGLFLGRNGNNPDQKSLLALFLNKTILCLLGAFLASFLLSHIGASALIQMALSPFHFVVAIFLYDLGGRIYREEGKLKKLSFPLIAFAFYMPLAGALIGLSTSLLLGLSVGDTTLFTTLTASASYIAVPAIMERMLPEADMTISHPLVLGLTFPFNILIGIQLYYFLASLLALP